MTLDSTQKLADEFAALMGPNLDAPSLAVCAGFFKRAFQYVVQAVADAAAATTSAYTLDFTDIQCRVIAIDTIASGAVAFNAANYAIYTLSYDNGAGGASTTVATWNTSAVGLTANQVSVQNSAAVITSPVVPAGSRLVLTITKAGTGVVIPQASYIVKSAPSA